MEEQKSSTTNAQHEYACWCKEINAEMDKLASMLKGLGPSEQVKDHFRNSRVEFLKGLRRMIDEKIERAQSHQSHGTTVPVE